MESNELLTVIEAAKFLKISKFTLYQWIRRGKVKKTPINSRNYRIKKSDLLEFLAGVYEANQEGQNAPQTRAD